LLVEPAGDCEDGAGLDSKRFASAPPDRPQF
jgi:hypothetical protein